MSKIVRNRSWSTYDELDKSRLVGGERLRISWPNGESSEEVVEITKWTESISDCGHSSDYSQERAILRKQYKGCPIWVRLEGLEATRMLSASERVVKVPISATKMDAETVTVAEIDDIF